MTEEAQHRHELHWRNLSIAEGLLLVCAATTLVVQRQRHSWPFAPEPEAPMVMASAAEEHGEVGATDPHAAHIVPGRGPVSIEPQRATLIGVTTTTAQRQSITEPVRTVATIAPDESRVSHVHTRVAGWIERLYVNTTGQVVRAGEPLAAIFSQELLASQSEYLSSQKGLAQASPGLAGAEAALADSARSRLRVLGMSDAEVAALDRSRTPMHDIIVVAPHSGVVLHRGITVGTSVDPSTELITVADLSRVWVFAEVPEDAIASVVVGTPVVLSFPAADVAGLNEHVEFLYPTLTEETRTLRVRITLANPTGTLRPGMYGTAVIQVSPRDGLIVPRDAVVDTGAEQHVFVMTSQDHYEPRRVTLGMRLEDRVEVRDGLREGESVVASGVFLLDSESRLRATAPAGADTMGGMGGMHHAGHGG
jgi:membrane fusion protein, copper/silver efflux system